MIKQITFENWKSFHKATLYIDPLTVLIGTNGSGKSNALEGLAFLSRIAHGQHIRYALEGDDTQKQAIRGGAKWSTFPLTEHFILNVIVQDDDTQDEYTYTLTIEPATFRVATEKLTYPRHAPESQGYPVPILLIGDTKPDLFLFYTMLGGLPLKSTQTEPEKHHDKIMFTVRAALKHIFILDPIPSHMRTYSQLSDTLHSDASNIAGFLANLPTEQKQHAETLLASYTTRLLQRDVQRIWAQPVGLLAKDAMLYCQEVWNTNDPLLMDASMLSDGTLRFLGILVALLTRPARSLLAIENVDDGLHPSQAELLVQMLYEIGQERKVDVLVTTHNPALLDVLEPRMIPFVTVVHRNPATGASEMTLLEDVSNLLRLLASGSLGQVAASGEIERSLKTNAQGDTYSSPRIEL